MREAPVKNLVLFGPERAGINLNEYLEGAPDLVVEIQSPGDESEEKLPFYAELGVPEVWIVHRDTKEPRVFILEGGSYEQKPPGRGGWVPSDFTGMEMRPDGRGKLEIRVRGKRSTRAKLPED